MAARASNRARFDCDPWPRPCVFMNGLATSAWRCEKFVGMDPMDIKGIGHQI